MDQTGRGRSANARRGTRALLWRWRWKFFCALLFSWPLLVWLHIQLSLAGYGWVIPAFFVALLIPVLVSHLRQKHSMSRPVPPHPPGIPYDDEQAETEASLGLRVNVLPPLAA
jgi:hypothetical protein